MPTRQAIVTYGVTTAAAATITLAALLQPWRAPGPHLAPPPPQPQPQPAPARHAVDVVFAVDTTGSMGGLIEGAKRTVWSIATHIRQTEPDAALRIGLVAYRDIGDDYVTRDFALTGDLDAVFAELAGYQADGGGDTPEDVAAALYDTLHRMQWRDDAKKLVFLVGDAPPADRGDVPRFDVLAREAGDRGILLNTIRCGLDSDTAQAWQQIAALGHGQFSSIEQDGGVQQVATPYDERLAELSARVDSTAVIVGDDGERAVHERNVAANAAAPAPAQADRAAYYATGDGAVARAGNDLVGGVIAGKMHAGKIARAALPAELRELSPEQLQAEIQRRAQLRRDAEAEMAKLARQRTDYLQANAKGGEGGFDAKVNSAVDAQLK
ncbi:MAG TPA: vWA domain-containing protein [Kofleriaceae bacterium]|jgi:hypothetical protein|nr:vWA domain-containing protein [Kofleriaceae bacterium]